MTGSAPDEGFYPRAPLWRQTPHPEFKLRLNSDLSHKGRGGRPTLPGAPKGHNICNPK